MYKIILDVHPTEGNSFAISYEGNDLVKLKGYINDTIINTMKVLEVGDGETFVEMSIEKDGKYYDHDEATVWVDFEKNSFTFEY